MAESRVESAGFEENDDRDERLESQQHEEAGERDERLEPQEVEDEEERKERAEYEKQLREILAGLETEEAAAEEGEEEEESEAAGGGEPTKETTAAAAAPAQLAAAPAAEQTAALSAGEQAALLPAGVASAGVSSAELKVPNDESHNSQLATHNFPPAPTPHSPTPVTQHSALSTQHSSALAKTDNRMLARREDGLSVSQHRALAMLAQGLTIPQAAMKAGVGRTTLYRWTQSDPQFRAAYNTWKQEQRESCRAALLKCADAAVARIAQRVEHDEDLAFKVVKELGLFKNSAGSDTTDPQMVHHEIEIQTLSTEHSLQRQHLYALCEKAGISEEQARAYFDWKKRQEAVEGKDAQTRGRGDAKKGGKEGPRGRGGDDDFDESDDDDDEFDGLDEDEREDDEEDEGEDDGTEGGFEGGVPSIRGLNSMLQSLMRNGVKDNK